MSDTIALPETMIEGMSSKHALVYAAWRSGADVRALFSRNTYYKYVREFKALYGIPLAQVNPRVIHAHVVTPMERPLRSYLSGPGMSLEAMQALAS